MIRIAYEEIRSPELGLGHTPVILHRWLRGLGDIVYSGDPLVQLIADSVLINLDAPTSGRLQQYVLAPGQEVSSGTILATICLERDLDPQDRA